MDTKTHEDVVEQPIILPAEFQSSFKCSALQVLAEARKTRIITTREIAAIMPGSAVVDRFKLRSAVSWLRRILGENGIILATGCTDLERRRLPLLIFVKSPHLSLQHGKLSDADVKFVEQIISRQSGSEFDKTELDLYREVFKNFPVLPHSEVIALVQNREKGDLEAHFRLILHNLRLVLSWANRYQGRGLDLGDLMQEGILGLMHGIGKFDWRTGNHLSTYVSWWIRQNITRAIIDRARCIRLPVHLAEKYYKIKRAREDLTKTLQREPTHAEIGDKIGMPARFVEKIIFTVMDTEADSMDETPEAIEREDMGIHNIIADTETLSPLSVLEAKEELELVVAEIRAFLVKLLEILHHDERWMQIFRMRYGLTGTFFARPTLESVGQKFGVSKERIRQIVEETWARLNAAGIKGDDDWLLMRLAKIEELESIVGRFAKI